MALSRKARVRWALVILLVGLPVYIISAVTIIGLFERPVENPPIWLELTVYVVLGIAWALPFRFIFRGIGRAEAEAKAGPDETTRPE